MWKIDTSQKTILALMKPYQHGIISMILECDYTMTTRQLQERLNDEGFIISRASVINYCKLLAANDVISFKEVTGKGGYHREYSKNLSWEQIIAFMHAKVLEKMTDAFPDSAYLKDAVDFFSK